MEYEHQFPPDFTGFVGESKASNDRVPSEDINNLPCHASQGTSVDEFPLTSREEEILGALSDGLSNSDIAEALSISLNTVETHLRHIYSKLFVKNRAQAMLWSIGHLSSVPSTTWVTQAILEIALR